MGPGSAGHGQWDELAYGEMTRSFGHGTDRTTSDVPVDVPGHTGPPVSSLEEREGPLAAWVSRARYLVY